MSEYSVSEYSVSDCPICGAEGTVTDHEGVNDSEYKNGYFKGLLIDYSECSACGSEFADAGQINRNAQRARERMKEEHKEFSRDFVNTQPMSANTGSIVINSFNIEECKLERGETEIEVSPEAVEELTNILSSKCL
jgi:C4-type Zn-finger protein